MKPVEMDRLQQSLMALVKMWQTVKVSMVFGNHDRKSIHSSLHLFHTKCQHLYFLRFTFFHPQLFNKKTIVIPAKCMRDESIAGEKYLRNNSLHTCTNFQMNRSSSKHKKMSFPHQLDILSQQFMSLNKIRHCNIAILWW